MRELNIAKTVVKIPQTWAELTQEQYVFLSGLLQKYSIHQIDFEVLKIMFVCKMLNLKIVVPKQRVPLINILRYVWSLLCIKTSRIRHNIKREDYLKFRSIAAEAYLKVEEKEDLLAFNLLQLSKEITFLNSDSLDISFLKNPIPELPGIGTGKKFNIGLIIDTDLTAGTYSDAMDLVIAWEETGDQDILNYLVAILYTDQDVHQVINNQSLIKKVSNLPLATKYAIYQWFISISSYFFKHPIYSHLYVGKKSEGDRIQLGMSETIIRLAKIGYGTIEEIKRKKLDEYMDLQIAELQETIRGALAAGIEPVKLAEKTGRTLTQIEQLS